MQLSNNAKLVLAAMQEILALAESAQDSAPPSPEVYLWDTFTAPNGSPLENRLPSPTPTGANVWLYDYGGVGQIQSNRASQASDDPHYHYEVGHADYTLTLLFNTSGFIDIFVRFTDVSNLFLLRSISNVMHIYKVEAGGFTDLANQSQTITDGDDHTATIICNGSSISFQVDAGTPLVASNAFNQTATKVGFALIHPTCTVDDFKVTA